MTKRIEIERAPNGMARLKTYVNGRLTGISETMALIAARHEADRFEGIIVDHTIGTRA